MEPEGQSQPIDPTERPSPLPRQEDGKPFRTAEQIIFRKEFEKSVKWIDERIANTNYMMGVILAVLAVGFITLLVAVYGIFIQNSQYFSTTVENLKQENQKLREERMNEKIKSLEEKVKQLKVTPYQPTPAPFPSSPPRQTPTSQPTPAL